MIRRKSDCGVELREHMRGGDGTVIITNFVLSNAELCESGRLFGRITLNPGCSIGAHPHEGESELFYILKGNGVYDDNGTMVPVSEGDVTICAPGESHGIANRSDEVLELIAVIINDSSKETAK